MGKRPDLVENADEQHVFTSFSDHAVFSQPLLSDDDVLWLVRAAGTMQVGIAAAGFFVRGAMTIGDVHHDREVVFGPGLIRAYDLESKVAKFPRIVLDPDAGELQAINAPFIVDCDGLKMIDPFTESFIAAATTAPRPTRVMDAYAVSIGIPKRVETSPAVMPPQVVLRHILGHIGHELSSTPSEEVREKLRWLFDRIADRLGDADSS